MSYWKEKWTEHARLFGESIGDAGAEGRLHAALDAVSVSLGPEASGTVTLSQVQRALGGNAVAAKAWMAWAERRSLIVRGTKARCSHCGTTFWRPLADAIPPLTCDGCGLRLDRPYNETSLNFAYRLGEPLRRAIENDSVYHLLVMRHLCEIFTLDPNRLVGAHPGVDFKPAGGASKEADVVLLFSDGDVLAVEVKKHSTALRDHDIADLEQIAAWFDSPNILFAAGDDDEHLTEEFQAIARHDRQPTRRLLTADDWLAPNPGRFLQRFPGPDVCQLTGSTSERRKKAQDFDDEFAKQLIAETPLDEPPDPVSRLINRQR
jgi:hypothetical protein